MNTLEVDDVLEVPTDKDIYACQCSRCDVLGVYAVFWRHNAFCQVRFGQRTRFREEFQQLNVLSWHRQQDVANRLWRCFQFGQSEVGNDENRGTGFEIVKQGNRPLLELSIETAADY